MLYKVITNLIYQNLIDILYNLAYFLSMNDEHAAIKLHRAGKTN